MQTASVFGFLLTADRLRAKPFYSDVPGLRVQSEDDFAAVLEATATGNPLRLTTVEGRMAGRHPVIGGSVPDIRASAVALATQGIRFEIDPGYGQNDPGIGTSPEGAVRVNRFKNPDGYVLSLTQG